MPSYINLSNSISHLCVIFNVRVWKKKDYELDSKSSLFTHKMVKPEPDRYVEALAEQGSRLKKMRKK